MDDIISVKNARMVEAPEVVDFSKPDQAIFYLMGELGLLGTDEKGRIPLENYEIMGEKLSAAIDKTKPWSAKYIHSVVKGYIEASPKLIRAIETLGGLLDGQAVGVAGAKFVRVLVFGDEIPDGVLLPKNARVARCKRASCPVMFIPTHNFQLYHDPVCAELARKEKKSNMRKITKKV